MLAILYVLLIAGVAFNVYFIWLFVCLFVRRWQDGARFEEFMARHAEESRDDLQAMKSLNVFYQVSFLLKMCVLSDLS